MSTDKLKPISVNQTQAAALLGVTQECLSKWRGKGIGPEYIRTSTKRNARVLYPYDDLVKWVDEHRGVRYEHEK